jgi:putative DNA primase/helicase
MRAEQILTRLKNVHRNGRGAASCCPAHDDRSPSLSICEGADGRILLKCFAGCSPEAIVAALGLQMSDLFARPSLAGPPPAPTRVANKALSIAELALAKGFSEAFLRDSFGLQDNSEGVLIPYYGIGGSPARTRLRTAIVAKDGSRWLAGAEPIVPYGVHRPRNDSGFLILVEGESDCWALWSAGFYAFGIPGATMAHVLKLEHVSGVQRIWLSREPDKAGRDFVLGVLHHLNEVGWQGEVQELRMPDGTKDPHELYLRDRSNFKDALMAAADIARPITLAEVEEEHAEAALHTVRADDVVVRRIEWFMRGRIPWGELTVFDGDGGLGKTSAALSLIAAATAGLPLPDGSTLAHHPRVIVLAEEDSLSTLKARLVVAGADLRLIRFVDYVQHEDGTKTSFTVPAHVPLLRRLVRQTGAELFYLDALFSHFDDGLNTHKSQDVRSALRPVAELAHESNIGIWTTRHWNKMSGTASSRGMGSVDIRNVARSVISFAKHPIRFDEEHLYVAAISKSNYGPPMDSLLYRIEAKPYFDDEGEEFEGGVGCVEWLGTDKTTADEVAGLPEPAEEKSARGEAREIILECLSTGDKPAKELDDYVDLHGIATRTYQRARRDLRQERIIARHGGGFAGPVCWSLIATDLHGPPQSPNGKIGGECAQVAMSAIANDMGQTQP